MAGHNHQVTRTESVLMMRTIFTITALILLLCGNISAQSNQASPSNPGTYPVSQPQNGPRQRTAVLDTISRIPPLSASAVHPIRSQEPPTANHLLSPQIKGNLFEPAQVVATVGGETILAGDLEAELMEVRSRLKENVTQEQFESQRPAMIKQILKKRIDTMLIYQDFLSQVPEERHAELKATISSQFQEKQLPVTLEKYQVKTVTELDALLRRRASSLQRIKREFVQQVIAHQMIRQSTETRKEITHEELLAYYQQHIADYQFPAKVRWEELAVEFRHYRNNYAAHRDIAEMGNEVLRGAPLGTVAKRSGQGPHHDQQGQYDWTTQGSLRSEPLDKAIFSLPIGELSQIIRDDDGFHIVRVLERNKAGRVPFTEAQVEIKEQIQEQRRAKKIGKYVKQIREQTPVWTIFDEKSPPTVEPKL